MLNSRQRVPKERQLFYYYSLFHTSSVQAVNDLYWQIVTILKFSEFYYHSLFSIALLVLIWNTSSFMIVHIEQQWTSQIQYLILKPLNYYSSYCFLPWTLNISKRFSEHVFLYIIIEWLSWYVRFCVFLSIFSSPNLIHDELTICTSSVLSNVDADFWIGVLIGKNKFIGMTYTLFLILARYTKTSLWKTCPCFLRVRAKQRQAG